MHRSRMVVFVNLGVEVLGKLEEKIILIGERYVGIVVR